MNELEQKLKKLREILREMKQVAVAYSGGVDSAFLLKVAVDTLGNNAFGVLAVSPTYPSREYEKAKDTAALINARLEIIETNEMNDEKFVNNPVNRCYFCKSELYAEVAKVAQSGRYANMVDGSNVDDMGDHRPGMQAVKEQNVRSPLQEAGMTKADIRELSRQLGLPTWDKEALACLSSRFPYGEKIDLVKLRMVDEAENFLRDLGFRHIRARHKGKTIQIEVFPDDISLFFADDTRQKVITKLKSIGYQYITVDLEGYRQGSMNEILPEKQLAKNLK